MSAERRLKEREAAQEQALDLDRVLEAMEDVADMELPDAVQQSLRQTAALIRSERNDRMSLAARLEAVEMSR